MDRGRIWGMLRGREAHVMPEPDGSLRPPVWLDGPPPPRPWPPPGAPAPGPGPAPHGRWRRGAVVGARTLANAAGSVVLDGAWRRADVDVALTFARRLRLLFESLGPTYVKLGQIISGGPGLFPEILVTEFERSRDAVPPFGWDDVRRVLAEDIPGGVNAFADFDPEPFGSASVAQVHHARLRDGRAVVVKVQRPGLAPKVLADLELMAAVARQGTKVSRAFRMANPRAIVEYFSETILEELDFRLEAENQLDVHEAVARSAVRDGVAVPRPHSTLVTRRVLTMERLEGFPYAASGEAVAAGVDTKEMLRSGFLCFLEGAVLHGVFHGDLHGGNIMICPDGRYGILDYGIVGRLSPEDRRAFASMMAAAAQGDVVGQLGAIRDMGAIPPGVDLAGVAAQMPAVPFFELRMPDAAELSEMLKGMLSTMVRLQFRLPKLLVLLTKNLIFLDDAVARFAPGMNMLAEAGTAFVELSGRLAEHDPWEDSAAVPSLG